MVSVPAGSMLSADPVWFFSHNFFCVWVLCHCSNSASPFLCLCFAQASQWLASVSVSMTLEFLPLTDKTVTIPFLLLNPRLCHVPSQETCMSVWGSVVFISCAASCMLALATNFVAFSICFLWFLQLCLWGSGGMFMFPRKRFAPVWCFPIDNMARGNLLLAS